MNENFLNLKPPILITSDHGGVELKSKIIKHFSHLQFTDLGPNDSSSVNYSDFAHKLCEQIGVSTNSIESNPDTMGILICGSGQGMAMTANKYNHIRAALCWNKESTVLARSHNNAQVLCLGARLTPESLAFDIVTTFLTTHFEGGRHIKRIQKISL